MDIQMPGMDGLEATRAIRDGKNRGLDPQVPVVALTAYAMKSDRERFLEEGMDGYVSKPVDVRVLQEELERVLDRGSGGCRACSLPYAAPADAEGTGAPGRDADQELLEHEDSLQRCRGDREFLDALRRAFLTESVRQQMDALRRALAEENLDAVARTAHSFKGACATVGAVRCRKLCLAMELAAKEGRARDANRAMSRLERALEATLERIRASLA
jgi:DNA-binding NarL/FixJ family response regulator